MDAVRDAVLASVQFGLLVICAVCGVIGVALLVADKRRPKHKTTGCANCVGWFRLENDNGICAYNERECRAGKRACEWERLGK